MTQTSKTSWGAKYSAKRITNTCKTPDEAAYAYDMYLKQHYPQKYSKFANFCEKCGCFVNPLGLPEYKNECGCSSPQASQMTSSPMYESSPGDVTSPESSTAGSPPNRNAVAGDGENGENGFDYRGSNLSVGSMKFSFSDDNEKFFDESFNMVADFETSQQIQDQEPVVTTYPGFEPPPYQKRDSIPLAVISSAVESFTKEDNLDQIIEDINRPSVTSFVKRQASFSNDPQQRDSKADLQHAIEPTSTSSTYVDFSMDELQDLSEYFLTDQYVPESISNPAMAVQPMRGSAADKQANYKKIHSLDFDSNDDFLMMDASDPIKQEHLMQDADAIANSFMHPLRPQALLAPSSLSAFPALIEIQTPFLEKYWRNDRKNIQCFPYCPEHGDYYRVRIEDLQHRCKGVCRAAVKARITIPTSAQPLTQQGLLVLARCNSTFSRNEALTSQAFLNTSEMKSLQALSAIGVIDTFSQTADGSGIHFDVTFYPDVWKFEFDLPKKRRNISVNSPVETEMEHLGSEFLYFFEIDVFYSPEKTSFQRLGHIESINFQIGNTRTLLRQRNKMTETDATPTGMANDGDRMLDVDTLPEKKKMKLHRQQLAMSTASISEDFDPSMVANDDNDLKQEATASSYITGEGISSSARRGEWIDPKKHMDVDKFFRMDSTDSAFHMEAGEGGDVLSPGTWKNQHEHEAQSSNYNPYLSPKPKEATLATANVAHGPAQHHVSQQKPAASAETYSLSKLFTYSLVCLPLGIVYVPVGLLLFVAFLVLFPLAPAVVRVLDTLSDSDLRNANSSCISSDPRRVLNRLAAEPVGRSENGGSGRQGSKLLRYHANGAVWSRFAYFVCVKLLVSVAAFVPTLLLSVLAVITFPIRPLSNALKQGACSCALWTREYTRSSVGKPFSPSGADVTGHHDQNDAATELV